MRLHDWRIVDALSPRSIDRLRASAVGSATLRSADVHWLDTNSGDPQQ